MGLAIPSLRYDVTLPRLRMTPELVSQKLRELSCDHARRPFREASYRFGRSDSLMKRDCSSRSKYTPCQE